MLMPGEMKRILSVIDATTSSFVELTKLAGLEPARSFRGADLRNVDLHGEDLAGFDFTSADLSGADLRGADLSRSLGVSRAILVNIKVDNSTLWPPQVFQLGKPVAKLTEADFDGEIVQDMILKGHSVPPAWRLLVKRLTFAHRHLTSIRLLEYLDNLEQLDISFTKVRDLAPLTYLRDVRYLDISSTQVTNLEPIARLSSLTHLKIRNTKVTKLDFISELYNMVSLDIGRTSISDISPLRHLVNLRDLNVSETLVSDLTPIFELRFLQTMDIEKTRISRTSMLTLLNNSYDPDH